MRRRLPLVLAAAALALVGGARPAPSPRLVTHGPRGQQLVALTFDADLTRGTLAKLRAGTLRSDYDPASVAELRVTRTPATIFLTGLWVRTYPAVVRSLAADPLFELENHSWDHSAWREPCFGLPAVRSTSAKRAEVVRAAAEIEAVAGVRPRFFRLPGGCGKAADVGLVASLGEQAIGWDVLSGDSFERDPSSVVRAVLAQLRPGSIVVMHLVGAPRAPATAAALRVLIPALRGRGFRPVTLRQLLGGP